MAVLTPRGVYPPGLKPRKSEIIQLLEQIMGSASAPAVVKETKAALDLVTPASETYGGLVLNDSDATKNGYYYRSSSAWVKGKGFPDTFAQITLGGTANAQTGTVAAGVSPADVLVYFATVSTANTGPMTLSISGETARDVVNAAGNALSAGEWTGTVIFFLNGDGDYQLLFDAGAVAAAAQSATDAAEARDETLLRFLGAYADDGAATTAAGTPTEGQLYWNTTDDILKSWNGSGWVSATQAAGTVTISTATGDGGDNYTLDAGAQATNTILVIGSLTQSSGFTLVNGALTVTGGVPAGISIWAISFEIVPLGATTAALVSTTGGQTLQQRLDRIVGINGLEYGMVADLGAGNTDNNAALQAAIDAAIASAKPLWLFGRYRVAGEIEITGPVTIFLAQGAELNFSGLGVGAAAFTLSHTTGQVVFDGHGTLSGPSVATYVGGERCIEMIGASTSDRLSGLIVRGIEIKDFGSDGVYCQFANDIEIDRCRIHNIGYAGAEFLSCDNGRVTNCQFYSMTPGASANMYGLAITHDSAGYNTDPALATPKLVANPFCRGWYVAFNEVWDINWEGLDCHGGYEVQIVHNRVYATRHGISVPSSSGDATPYSGYDNIVANNIVDGRNRDGSTSGRENLSYGINLNGGSIVNHMNIVCQGNVLVYKGLSNNTNSGAIQALYCLNAVIADNAIDFWGGAGVLFSASGGKVANNMFGPCAAASTDNACVREDIGSTRRVSVTGNVHDPRSGNAATYGFRQAGSPAFTPTSAGNDFRAAGTPLSAGTPFAGQ